MCPTVMHVDAIIGDDMLGWDWMWYRQRSRDQQQWQQIVGGHHSIGGADGCIGTVEAHLQHGKLVDMFLVFAC